MIPEKILLKRGATIRKIKKNENIFFEGDRPYFFYQVMNGTVKMVSINMLGKEYIQGIFTDGQSFGEPVLLIDKPYPATAVAADDTTLLKLKKEDFIRTLRDFPELHLEFTKTMARRIYQKSLLARAISANGPEERTLSFLKLLKNSNGDLTPTSYKVTLSRQQIADMIGFRVETVIRTIKKLEKKELIRLEIGKNFL